MKSSWKGFERQTSDLGWGILTLIPAIGLLVLGVYFLIDDDASLIFILWPLGGFFLYGSISFFISYSRAKRRLFENKSENTDGKSEK